MNADRKKEKKAEEQKARKLRRKKKKNALVICRDGNQFWTTQAQFWQWVRENVVKHTGHGPLRGEFLRENEEYNVTICNTVLNLAHPNHLREALGSRRFMNN